jgi:hypothetical protein
MDFLNHREGGAVSIRFYSFLLYRNCKSCVGLKKSKSQGEALEVTVNTKEENFLFSGFRPRIRPLGDVSTIGVTLIKAILLYLRCNSDRVLSLLV